MNRCELLEKLFPTMKPLANGHDPIVDGTETEDAE